MWRGGLLIYESCAAITDALQIKVHRSFALLKMTAFNCATNVRAHRYCCCEAALEGAFAAGCAPSAPVRSVNSAYDCPISVAIPGHR